MANEMIPVAQVELIAQQNSQTAAQLSQMVDKLAIMLVQMDARQRALETIIQQRVTITAAQAKALTGMVTARAHAICDKYHLPYQQCGASIRAAMWREIKTRNVITSAYDLPAGLYSAVCDSVAVWDSFSLVRALRAKHGL